MPNPSMAERLLAAADVLLETSSRSTAFRRRAISTAYYAVFHAVAKACADYLSRSKRRSDEDYVRVYRALDHASMKKAVNDTLIRNSPQLRKIGQAFVDLQSERHRADYMPPAAGLFTNDRARELVTLAKETVREIESLTPNQEELRTLAIGLLFKERNP